MIKKYTQFIKESNMEEIQDTQPGTAKINLSNEDADMFSTEPALQRLIVNKKVSLLPPELWYSEDDNETINVLKEFFPELESGVEDYDENTGRGYDLKGDQGNWPHDEDDLVEESMQSIENGDHFLDNLYRQFNRGKDEFKIISIKKSKDQNNKETYLITYETK